MVTLEELRKYDGEGVKYFSDAEELADNEGEFLIIEKDGEAFPAIKTLVAKDNALVPGYLRLDPEKIEIERTITEIGIFIAKGGYKILDRLD